MAFAGDAQHDVGPEFGRLLAFSLHVGCYLIDKVDGKVIIFLGTFFVEQLQNAVAARLETDGDSAPVGLTQQCLKEIGPLTHRVRATCCPVGPNFVGASWILFNPFAQPLWILEEHGIVDDDRTDAILVVELIEFVNHGVHRTATHVGNIGVLVAEHALPRADAAGENRCHRPWSPAALRLHRP
jgi:hypothetical protein